MILAGDWRRQARVCARLAEACDDQQLAERLRLMAANLVAKADEIEDPPTAASTPKDIDVIMKHLRIGGRRPVTGEAMQR